MQVHKKYSAEIGFLVLYRRPRLPSAPGNRDIHRSLCLPQATSPQVTNQVEQTRVGREAQGRVSTHRIHVRLCERNLCHWAERRQ